MEEPENSSTSSLEDSPMDDHPEDQAIEIESEEEETDETDDDDEEGEYIGVDPQETRQDGSSIGDNSNLADFLSTEIEIKEEEMEIKEEEVEIDPAFLQPDGEAEDPFGSGDEETASRESSTDTADEALVEEPMVKKRKLAKPATNIAIRARPVANIAIRKPSSRRVVMASQFVSGMMDWKNNTLLCLECSRKFDSPESFAVHRQQLHVHLPNLPHTCSYCPRKFGTSLELQRHLLHHTWLEALCCPVCHAAMSSAKGLADHWKGHYNRASTKCNLCSEKYFTPKMLETHNREVHSKLPVVNKTVFLSQLVCFACGQQKSTLKDLRIHMRSHMGAVMCKICGLPQHDIDKLATHVSTVHQNHGTISFLLCPNCNEIQYSKQQMVKHKETCKLPGSFRTRFRLECQICNLSYFTLEHYETHMRLHSILGQEKDQQPCSQCSFYSKNSSEYALHMTNVHGFRDTLESLENDYESTFNNRKRKQPPPYAVKCFVPDCKYTYQPGMTLHNFPMSNPDRWNLFRDTYKLPSKFMPKPGQRVCGHHFSVVGNRAKEIVKM